MNHHVTVNIDIDKAGSTLALKLGGYQAAANYLASNDPLRWEKYVFQFSVLPAPVLAKIVELRDLIEQELIANLPEWSGGTRVNDDGTAI